MTDKTPEQIDAEIAQLQAQKSQIVNAELEQKIYEYFSQLPQEEIMTVIGKLLTSNPMMIWAVKTYMQKNPIQTKLQI